MKVFIQEIEELVVTDPAGLCNPSAQQGIPMPQMPGIPQQPQGWPIPQMPSPMAPFPGPTTPWPGVVRPGAPAIYTRPRRRGITCSLPAASGLTLCAAGTGWWEQRLSQVTGKLPKSGNRKRKPHRWR